MMQRSIVRMSGVSNARRKIPQSMFWTGLPRLLAFQFPNFSGSPERMPAHRNRCGAADAPPDSRQQICSLQDLCHASTKSLVRQTPA